MYSTFRNIPGQEFWKSPVNSIIDLPPSGNENGDVRLVLNINLLYSFNGNEWVEINAGGGGGTVTSVNGQIGTVILDTSDIPEAPPNLYFTNQRAEDAVGSILANSPTVNLTYSASTITATVTSEVMVKSVYDTNHIEQDIFNYATAMSIVMG